MRKSTKQMILGLVLFVTGAIIIPTIFCISVALYLLNNEPLAKFVIPGQTVVTIEEQGRYYLWNDYQTILNGRTYSSSEELPDELEISLLENKTGNKVEFTPNQSMTSSAGDSHKNSIGYFEIDTPAIYILTISGEFSSRVVSFEKSLFDLCNKLNTPVIFSVTILAHLVAFIFTIAGIINFVKARKNIRNRMPDGPDQICS